MLIRHGESKADLLDVHEERAEFSLTERGHQQAKAECLAKNYQIDRIYASRLTRAAQSAPYLSEMHRVPVQPETDLIKFNNDLFAGLPHKEAAEKHPRIPDVRLTYEGLK